MTPERTNIEQLKEAAEVLKNTQPADTPWPCQQCECADYEGLVANTCTCSHSMAVHVMTNTQPAGDVSEQAAIVAAIRDYGEHDNACVDQRKYPDFRDCSCWVERAAKEIERLDRLRLMLIEEREAWKQRANQEEERADLAEAQIVFLEKEAAEEARLAEWIKDD